MTRYEDVIQEEDQNLLATWRDSMTDMQFGVGDIANRYADKAKEIGVTRQFIWGGVGSFYGKASRTIREYATVSSFYPPHVRREFSILSFDHFRVAMRTDDWQRVLEYAMNSRDNRPATVDACIAEFGIHSTDPDSLENALKPLLKYIYKLPGSAREQVMVLIEEIEDVIKEATPEAASSLTPVC